jgi:hypothetical protein
LKVTQFVQQQSPDWISFQYVPHAYDDKGLPFHLAKGLIQLSGGLPLRHIFCHELWVEGKSSLKRTILSHLQRSCLRRIFRQWKPILIATSNPRYVVRLNKLGETAACVPVFSNIPVVEAKREREAFDIRQPFRCVHFGKLLNNFPLDQLIQFFTHLSLELNAVDFRILGSTRGGEDLIAEMRRRLPSKISLSCLGWLDEAHVSQEFSEAGLAVVSSPASLLGKSGAVAAIRAHRLPFVILDNDLSDDPVALRKALGSEGHILDESMDEIFEWRKRIPLREPGEDLRFVAAKFLGALSSHEHASFAS